MYLNDSTFLRYFKFYVKKCLESVPDKNIFISYTLKSTDTLFDIMKKIIFLVLSLVCFSSWCENPKKLDCSQQIRIECHPSLFTYLRHATFRPDPFRGPGCQSCYKPVIKPWVFAQ